MKILIADDDPQLLRALRITLTAQGYEIVTAIDGADALRQAVSEHPDLVVLDLGMPALDGLEVIHGLRGWSGAPVLVVSGRAGTEDKVEALDAGADDYLTKPFSVEELLARVRALTRRLPAQDAAAPPELAVTLGEITIDLAARSIVDSAGGGRRQIKLTPTEWHMIDVLVRNSGRLVTRQTLLTQIWGTEHVADTGYLRLYMSQLRKKLERDAGNPRYLITEPGMGYRLRLEGEA